MPGANGWRSVSSQIPASLVGGALIAVGARHIKRDISLVVEELLEERDEMERLARVRGRGPGAAGAQPGLQLRDRPGALRRGVRREKGGGARPVGHQRRRQIHCASSDLRTRHPRPRESIRLNGRTITYTEAEARVRLGVVQMPGGRRHLGALDRGGEPSARRVSSNVALPKPSSVESPLPSRPSRRSARGWTNQPGRCRAANSRCSPWQRL